MNKQRHRLGVFTLCLFSILFIPWVSPKMSTAAHQWAWKNVLPQGDPLSSVAFGSTTFVAVGRGGMILTSPNGTAWTLQNSGTEEDLSDVTFGSGIFVVVGSAGTVLTSPDGISWTPRTSGTPNDLAGVVFGTSGFVTVGKLGVILTSPTGAAWTPRTSNVSDDLLDVTFGNNFYVSVGRAGTILSSPTGVTWTFRSSGVPNNSLNPNDLFGVSFANMGGIDFVAVGRHGLVLTSPDVGVTWAPQTSGTTNDLLGVSLKNGNLFAVGEFGTILTSSNGANWTPRASGATRDLSGEVAFGNNTYVAVGDFGTILSSLNGTAWTLRTSGPADWLFGIAFGNNIFVGAGESGKIFTSPDGTTWTPQPSGTTNDLNGVAFGNGTFVAAGGRLPVPSPLEPPGLPVPGEGTIATSTTNGVSWTPQTVGTNRFFGVAFGNSTFVAVGGRPPVEPPAPPVPGEGTIATSTTNGASWTPQTVGTRELFGVAFGSNIFVAVGAGGTILTSINNGATWIPQTVGTSDLFGVAFGNNIFVAVGASGRALTSPNGFFWTVQTSGAIDDLFAISFGSSFAPFGSFVAVGGFGAVLTSLDGVTWIFEPSATSSHHLIGVAYANNNFVAVGSAGVIVQSDVTTEDLVIKYYNDILHRLPDTPGWVSWTTEIERTAFVLGVDLGEGFQGLGRFFFDSTEYNLPPGKTDSQFVTDVYETFLNRPPDPAGLANWLSQLASGLTRDMLITGFANSAEFELFLQGLFGVLTARPENNLVNDFYRGFLDRLPDTGGFNSWLSAMRAAQCTGAQAVADLSHQIALGFIHSPEYAARSRNNSGYVEDLYNGILRRPADIAGFNAWVTALNGLVMTRDQVLQAFTNSPEFQSRVTQVINAGCLP